MMEDDDPIDTSIARITDAQQIGVGHQVYVRDCLVDQNPATCCNQVGELTWIPVAGTLLRIVDAIFDEHLESS